MERPTYPFPLAVNSSHHSHYHRFLLGVAPSVLAPFPKPYCIGSLGPELSGLTESLDLNAELRGLGADRKLVSATEIHHANLKAVNTESAPNTVAPHTNSDVTVTGEAIKAKLKPASWNVIVTQAKPRAV